MKHIYAVGRRVSAAAMIALSSMGMSSVAPAASVEPKNDPNRPVRVSARDIEASNQKVAAAYNALVKMWSNNFRQIGEQFVAPRVLRYTGAARTACGVIRGNNALYCPTSNAIYYDEVFVAGMAKVAANAVGTDGDMAAVGIIAHEMGHAVAMQLGYVSRNSYKNESTADCLAGAFAKQADRDGQIEPGDIDEAIFGMSMAGDPSPESTGNDRVDAILQARLERNAHGTRDQRMQNFRDGLDGGARACLADFR